MPTDTRPYLPVVCLLAAEHAQAAGNKKPAPALTAARIAARATLSSPQASIPASPALAEQQGCATYANEEGTAM